jgi:hypothetical protein
MYLVQILNQIHQISLIHLYLCFGTERIYIYINKTKLYIVNKINVFTTYRIFFYPLLKEILIVFNKRIRSLFEDNSCLFFILRRFLNFI